MDRRPKFTILFVYFVSGACGLMYETVWLRLLKLTLGNTTIATSITVAIFMAGLALGAFLIGKRTEAILNKLKAYAFLELCVAVYALFTLPLLSLTDSAYVGLFRTLSPSPTVLFVLQIVVSSLLLILPAALMGMTLPLLASSYAKESKTLGAGVGLLYGVNTAGALAGTFGAGFFFLPTMGVRGTLFVSAAINTAIAVFAYVMSRGKVLASRRAAGDGDDAQAEPSNRRVSRLAGVWLFISGFVALGYEIVWVRTAAQYLKATTFTFSSILCAYLLGYAAGMFCGGRHAARTKNPLFRSVISAQLVGLAGVLCITSLVGFSDLLSQRLGWYTDHLLFSLDRFFLLPYCFILYFVPSFLMGYGFPFLLQLKRRQSIGGVVASAYALNTLGSVAGSLVTAFVLIPLLGSQRSIEALGVVATVGAVLSLPHLSRRREKLAVVGLFLAAALLVAIVPKDLYVGWINRIEGKDQQTDLVDIADGITTTASVHHYRKGNFTVITTAGINVAGDQIALRQTQKAQGHIPVILHGGPQSVLTVGFGSGELTKLLTLHKIPDITCVELSPEMVVLSKKHFAHINLGGDLERQVNMVYMDAKNYIHLTGRKFDVILNDSIWPGLFADNSSLYTQEYFQDGKERLNDDGVYSSWLPLSLSQESFKTIARTFMSVFENTLLIYPHFAPSQHVLLVGQKKAHPYSYQKMVEQFDRLEVRESLEMIGVRSVEDIVASVFSDFRTLDGFVKDAPLNTDYFPVIEFAPDLYRSGFHPFRHWENLYNLLLLGSPNGDVSGYSPFEFASYFSFAGSDGEEILASLARRQRANAFLLLSFMYLGPEKKLHALEEGLAIDPYNADLVNYRRTLEMGE